MGEFIQQATFLPTFLSGPKPWTVISRFWTAKEQGDKRASLEDGRNKRSSEDETSDRKESGGWSEERDGRGERPQIGDSGLRLG